MLSCWQEDPDNRPTFENLRSELKRMENQHKVKNNNHLFFFLVLEKLAKKTCYGLFFRWRNHFTSSSWYLKIILVGEGT